MAMAAPSPQQSLLWGQKITPFRLLLALAMQRRLIARAMLVFTALSVLYALSRRTVYESSFTMIPPPHVANRHMDRSFQDLWAALDSDDEGFRDKNAETYWPSAVQRPDILDRVIRDQDLMHRYGAKRMSDAESTLKSVTTFKIDRAKLLTVKVLDTSPRQAQETARAYIRAIQASMTEQGQLDSGDRIALFAAKTEEAKASLREAESHLVETQLRTGAITIGPETAASLGIISRLRASITADQIAVNSLRQQMTEQNPVLERQLAKLQADEDALAAVQQARGQAKPGVLEASDAPSAEKEYTDAVRNVKMHEALYLSMGKQLSKAKTDAERGAPIIQLVETPQLPDQPGGIPRTVVALLGIASGFLLSCILALLRQVYLEYKATPTGSRRVHALEAVLHRPATASQ